MAGRLFCSLFNSTLTLHKTSSTNLRTLYTAPVLYAARKGTRAKARAKKVKVEITKVGFIPHNQRGNKKLQIKPKQHFNDTYKPLPKDDVYPLKYFRWVVYSAEDAVKAHQETHHPTMYNLPDAFVYAEIELNMQAAKKTRTMDNFNRLTLLPHMFPRDEERTILAFCKGQEMIKQALEAGATTVGSTEIIKKIQEGEIRFSDYDYVIAHPNILTDLVPIRGLIKRRFPSVRAGTLDADLPALVKKFAAGVQYRVAKDENSENYAKINIPIGRLNMEPKFVAENLEALLKDLQSIRPKRDGLFITSCLISSPPSLEKLKVNPFVYVEETLAKEVAEDSDGEDDNVVAATAAA